MNYAPDRWCFECKRARPKDEFVPLTRNSPRVVCADCKERIEKLRESIKPIP